MKTINLITSLTEILICIRPLLADVDFECKEEKSPPGISCISSSSGDAILPGQRIPGRTKNISIITKGEAIWKIDKIDVISRFRDLTSLTMELSRAWKYSDNLMDRESQKKLSDEFFAKTKLRYLSISYSSKNTQSYKWILPVTLNTFKLSNSVFNYDLSNCYKMMELNFTNTDVTNMPRLSDESRINLRRLIFRNNPLSNFTVNYIAEYCVLIYIVIKDSKLGNCERARLKKWVEKLKSEGEEVELDIDPIDKGGAGNCNGYTLDEATRLRKGCRQQKSKRDLWLLIAIIIFLIVCLSIGLCLFCLSRYKIQAITLIRQRFGW